MVKEDEKGITIKIPRPEGMSLERFTVLIARLERIIDELGGSIHVSPK